MKNAKKDSLVSPFTYKPENYRKLKIKCHTKQTQPRITMAMEFMTSDVAKVPHMKYKVIEMVRIQLCYLNRTKLKIRHPYGK